MLIINQKKMATIDKLKLLIWKNFLLQRRHKWQTLFEILSPVIFSLFIILIRCLVAPKYIPEMSYTPFYPTYFNSTGKSVENLTSSNMILAFSPENPLCRNITRDAMATIASDNFGFLYSFFFDANSLPRPKGYKNAKEMEQALIQPYAMNHVLVGIQFDDDMANATSWPDDINVTLRFPAIMRNPSVNFAVLSSWRTNLIFPLFPQSGPREPEDKYGGKSPGYSTEMFLGIQHAVSQGIIKQKTGKRFNTKIYLQRLPQLSSNEDQLLVALERFVSMILMLGFVYTFVNTVKAVTTEKELQLKETMAIMGLSSWLHWLAWFIKQFSFLLISVIIIVTLFKIPFGSTESGEGYAVFTFTPWSVLLFFMVLFTIVSLAFSFMISVFFSRANTAASVMAIIWFATFAVFMFTQMIFESVKWETKLMLSIFSNTAISFAFQMIIIREGTSTGLQWNDFFKPISYHDQFQPGHVVLMLILDSIVYMLIAMYVEKIRPGQYGVPLPWYFPFTKSFWISNKNHDNTEAYGKTEADMEYNDALLKTVYDEEPKNVAIGVNIQNLSKTYKGRRKAVDDINLRVYENEITVLLGHNGAGKTTTISMLTGVIPPSSGSATINGYNIVTETEQARNSLGICPQHNVLFPDLTVAEHIIFYSRLKCVHKRKLKDEVDHFVKLLDLEDKRDTMSSQLSGGQKRRLSVGCAMCGSSRVVLLDEPTSGLDPAARRALWDLLQREKRGRTMILTTHFMDEADVLADRIAIMAAGRLQCVGTPYFLKKHYGIGYKLTIAKDDECVVEDVTRFFEAYVPNIKKNSNIGSELTYILPNEYVSKFPEMLREFEERRQSFHVSSYGLSVTSLEEVFMKAGAEDTTEVIKNGTCHDASHCAVTCPSKSDAVGTVRGFELLWNHIKAMFLKLTYTTTRNKGAAFIQLMFPIINIVLSMIISGSWKLLTELPPLQLTLDRGFKTTETLISEGLNLTETNMKTMVSYKDYFKTSPHPDMTITDIGTMSIEKFYLKMCKADFPRVRYEIIAGATFSANNITAWFSNYGYHDSAISLALVDNAIMRALSPGTSLKIINHPLPYSVENMIEIMTTGVSMAFMLSFTLGFCIAIVSSFIVLNVIKERVSGAKLLQRVAGLRPAVMWGTSFIWDYFWLFIIYLIIIATIASFQEIAVSTPEELGRVLLVLMVFSIPVIPMHYLASFFFDEPATGFTKMIFVNIFTGSMLFLITEVLRLPQLDCSLYAEVLDYLFSLLPIYCVSRSVREMIVTSIKIKACDGLCRQLNVHNCTRQTVCERLDVDMCCFEDNIYLNWEEPGVGRYLITMIVVGVTLFLVLLIKEYELINKFLYSPRSYPVPCISEDEDDDVAKERDLVHRLKRIDTPHHSLVCKDLTKYYREFLAVNRVSFAVRKGECFGLLGVNGAGKTSTFCMVTGDVRISGGDALVHGHSVKTHVRQVHQLIGYCPQFDALFDNLTARETLRIFCLLRGIPIHVGDVRAISLATALGFLKHYDKKIYQCSGGTKRKISTAVALLGDSPVIFLDEPTTGMDPASKRLVWSAISQAMLAGRSIVLTSHSMEECEALCSRVTIMVNGRFYCLGSLQHLKSKFTQGYTLVVKCESGPNRDTNLIKINEYITDNFIEATLVETYLGISTYYVKGAGLEWWRVFYLMEEARKQFPIEDYSVSQTTLEQVFLRFTKSQINTQ